MAFRLPITILVLALSVLLGGYILKQRAAELLIAYGNDSPSREKAAGLAPGNPEVVAARGKYLLYRAEPPESDRAIIDLQRAAAISPRDYRFWLELGRAYESCGESTRAETALRRSVDLAPRYFEARWALANLLLREKPRDAVEAFRDALRFSGKSEGKTDWLAALNAYQSLGRPGGMNAGALKNFAPQDDTARAALAFYFSTHRMTDDALGIWRTLKREDKKLYGKLSLQLLRDLQNESRFYDVKEVWREVERLAGYESPAGRRDSNSLILNSGFETIPVTELIPELNDTRNSSPAGLDWILQHHTEVRVGRTDAERRSGSYSLHISFPVSMRSEFKAVSQTIVVDPSSHCVFSFFVKTKNTPKSPDAAPFVEIGDPTRQEVVLARIPVQGGTNDWSRQSMEFTVPPNLNGLKLTLRSPQITAVDPSRIAEMWFDDFSLEDSSGNSKMGREIAKHTK